MKQWNRVTLWWKDLPVTLLCWLWAASVTCATGELVRTCNSCADIRLGKIWVLVKVLFRIRSDTSCLRTLYWLRTCFTAASIFFPITLCCLVCHWVRKWVPPPTDLISLTASPCCQRIIIKSHSPWSIEFANSTNMETLICATGDLVTACNSCADVRLGKIRVLVKVLLRTNTRRFRALSWLLACFTAASIFFMIMLCCFVCCLLYCLVCCWVWNCESGCFPITLCCLVCHWVWKWVPPPTDLISPTISPCRQKYYHQITLSLIYSICKQHWHGNTNLCRWRAGVSL